MIQQNKDINILAKILKQSSLSVLIIISLLFHGCGGGGGSSTTTDNDTPAIEEPTPTPDPTLTTTEIFLQIGEEVEVLSNDQIIPNNEETRIELRHVVSDEKKYVTLLSGSATLIRGDLLLE